MRNAPRLLASAVLAASAGLTAGVVGLLLNPRLNPVPEASAKKRAASEQPATAGPKVVNADADRRIGDRPNPRTSRRHPNGPGWSYRHVKRLARKRRNQARNRTACRRRGH